MAAYRCSNQVLRAISTNSIKASILCWNCQKVISLPENSALFFCPCEKRKILPITNVNYFHIFGLVPQFSFDSLLFKQKFLELQRRLHPDKFSLKSEYEKECSAQQSSLINKAYSVLSVPYERGLYLLNMLGYEITEEDSTQISDILFLEEIMSLNEKLEDQSMDNLIEVQHIVKGFLGDYTLVLEENFQSGELSSARENLKKMKYYININNKLQQLILPPE